jgi:hypothetical protein
MNPTRHVRRLAAAVGGLASVLLAFAVAAPSALARPGPPHPWQVAQRSLHPLQPGWYKHTALPRGYYVHYSAHQGPVPAAVRTVVTGGMPGWQIAPIAAGAALLAATAAVLAYRAWIVRRRPSPAAA